MSLSERADALEEMHDRRARRALDRPLATFAPSVIRRGPRFEAVRAEAGEGKLKQMGHDPRLPRMPDKPTLVDFFEKRFAPARHLLQSGALALEAGLDEETVLACLLHDVGVFALARSDHGYWGAQLIEPYVSERVSWGDPLTIKRCSFFPDPSRSATSTPSVLHPLLR